MFVTAKRAALGNQWSFCVCLGLSTGSRFFFSFCMLHDVLSSPSNHRRSTCACKINKTTCKSILSLTRVPVSYRSTSNRNIFPNKIFFSSRPTPQNCKPQFAFSLCLEFLEKEKVLALKTKSRIIKSVLDANHSYPRKLGWLQLKKLFALPCYGQWFET
jgi:hypothetical protein